MMPANKSIVKALEERRFRDAERAAIQLVKQEPLNPQGWVFLAEALLQQGFTKTAHKAFERAWLLDPTADWVRPVFTLLSKLEDRVPRFDVEALMAYSEVTVKAIVIVDEDAQMLSACLASLKKAVDIVQVVDIGASGEARAMIAAWPDERLQYFERGGVEHVASMLNEMLEQVNSDWVIVVMGNELLFPQDVDAIRCIAALYDRVEPAVALRVGRERIDVNRGGELVYDAGRMFPVGKGFRFWGRANPCIGDELGPHHDEVSDILQRRVRLRFAYSEGDVVEREHHHTEPLLEAAKANVLKAKQCFKAYRGRAIADLQIASWKGDQLLAVIEKANTGEQNE